MHFFIILMKSCGALVLSIFLSLFLISGESGGAEASQVGQKYQKWNSFKGLETKCKNQGPVECMKKIFCFNYNCILSYCRLLSPQF